MGLLERIAESRRPRETRDNETVGISMTDWQNMWRPGSQVTYQGMTYQAYQMGASGSMNSGFYESNGIVFACEAKRLSVFSEARFQYQQLRNGRPGDLFGTPDLSVLEQPWPGASTRDLLVTAELDVATYGNSYWIADRDGYLVRLDPANRHYEPQRYRPDQVQIQGRLAGLLRRY